MSLVSRYFPRNGFTLIETLIAVSILMITMVALMSLARVGISQSIFSKERVVAQYLAHDAMRYVINMHHNDIQDQSADEFSSHILTKCDTSRGCRITTTTSNYNSGITECMNATACPRLRRDGSTYRHTGSGSDSIYSRAVYAVNDPTAPHDTQVRVRVWWIDDSGTERSVEIYRHFLSIGTLLAS